MQTKDLSATLLCKLKTYQQRFVQFVIRLKIYFGYLVLLWGTVVFAIQTGRKLVLRNVRYNSQVSIQFKTETHLHGHVRPACQYFLFIF